MQGQIVQFTNAAPSIDLYFFDADGLPLTTIAHNTPGLSLAFVRGTAAPVSITLAAQTPTGAYTAGGFCHVSGGKCRLDLPTTANAAGLPQVSIVAPTLPTGARFAPFVVALTPDDLTAAGPSAAGVSTQVMSDLAGAPGAAARTAIGASVDTAVADNFAAIPTAVQTAAAVRDELLSVSWGLQTVPPGGSQQVLTITDTPSGTVLGVVRRQFDSGGRIVGQTQMTAS